MYAKNPYFRNITIAGLLITLILWFSYAATSCILGCRGFVNPFDTFTIIYLLVAAIAPAIGSFSVAYLTKSAKWLLIALLITLIFALSGVGAINLIIQYIISSH